MHVQTVLALLQEPPPRAAVLAAEHISHDLSPAASSLISSLLALQPSERLGAGGAAEVEAHAFFESIDWARLVRLELPPPLPCLDALGASDR